MTVAISLGLFFIFLYLIRRNTSVINVIKSSVFQIILICFLAVFLILNVYKDSNNIFNIQNFLISFAILIAMFSFFTKNKEDKQSDTNIE